MEPERQRTLIPLAMLERDRFMRSHEGEEPDVLIVHPHDAMLLAREISDQFPWLVEHGPELGGRLLTQPPVGEVQYGQFMGMDITPCSRLPRGFFVVAKRRPFGEIVVGPYERRMG